MTSLKYNGVWRQIRDYLFIALGILSYTFGFSAFVFPEKVVVGGLAGLGTVVYFVTERLFGWGVPVAITQYVVNLLLLAMSYKIVGKEFVIRTVYGATLVALALGILMPMFPEPLVKGQPFMSVLLGGILGGIGLGTVFVHNGSTGGTDIVAAVVAKKSNTSVGRTMLYTDFCIISSSFLIFHSVELVVYGFIFLFVISVLTDWIINSNKQAIQIIIFSPKWEEIATAINNNAHRGCTVLDGMGWYSKKSTKVLMVLCRKQESINIFRIIKAIDPDALASLTNCSAVYGEGFDHIKLKM